MNRRFTEEEMHAADIIGELTRLLGQLNISDESFLDEVKHSLPQIKERIQELEKGME